MNITQNNVAKALAKYICEIEKKNEYTKTSTEYTCIYQCNSFLIINQYLYTFILMHQNQCFYFFYKIFSLSKNDSLLQ